MTSEKSDVRSGVPRYTIRPRQEPSARTEAARAGRVSGLHEQPASPPLRTTQCASTHSTSVLMSASFTFGLLGGIGTGPHTPEPPIFTFLISLSFAVLSPLYFLATSL